IQRGEKRVKPSKYHRKRSTYIYLKLGREGGPWYLTHITTQCLNASEQKYQLRPAAATGLKLPVKLTNSSGSCSCPYSRHCFRECSAQEQQIALNATSKACLQLSTRETYCKDLSTSPATENSAGPCCLSHLITGVILLAVGVWGKLTLGTYISLIAENSTNAPYVLIGTGTTIIVFGLFGCFATCRGSPWMLKLYAMFLSLVFLAELVAGISGFVFRHEIKDTFLRTYTEAIQNYNKNDERSHAVDNVQESLSCCGIQSYTNWSTSPYFFKHGIPTSCCMNSSDCNTQDLRNMTVAATKVNQKGCYDLVTSFMETNMGIIAGVAFGIAFSQLIGMLLACCLSRFITANQYEMV
uniref:Tetraspanin-7 n=1 Tax=Ficedula albicollis TaxID=59894 RepID=A0A803V461_FICAL